MTLILKPPEKIYLRVGAMKILPFDRLPGSAAEFADLDELGMIVFCPERHSPDDLEYILAGSHDPLGGGK